MCECCEGWEGCRGLCERLDCQTPECNAWLDTVCPSKQVCTHTHTHTHTHSLFSSSHSNAPHFALPCFPVTVVLCVWTAVEMYNGVPIVLPLLALTVPVVIVVTVPSKFQSATRLVVYVLSVADQTNN